MTNSHTPSARNYLNLPSLRSEFQDKMNPNCDVKQQVRYVFIVITYFVLYNHVSFVSESKFECDQVASALIKINIRNARCLLDSLI